MRRFSIRAKLAFVLSGFSLLLVGGLLLAVKVSFDQGFEAYLNESVGRRMQALAVAIAEEAQSAGGLEAWARQPQHWEQMLHQRWHGRPAGSVPGADGPAPLRPGAPPEHADLARLPGRGLPVWLQDEAGAVLLGPRKRGRERAGEPPRLARLDGTPLAAGEVRRFPVLMQGRTVGWLVVPAPRPLDDDLDAVFAARQHKLFALMALVAVLASVLLAWPLSRYLVRPVQRISKAMHALMQRDYAQRVEVSSGDELGALSRDFNSMAQALGEHDLHQRQWLADISHELRTPLAVLKGELEALQDGVIPLAPQALDSLLEEVNQLGRLVDDLHQLAVTQSAHLRYRFETLDLAALVQQVSHQLQPLLQQARLAVAWPAVTAGVSVRGDAQRLTQLLLNLGQNSARYTHPDGQVRVTLEKYAEEVLLVWEDSAPGVDEADLPHLFERFYRVEHSRQRALAGSGLGLSIVANIVRAHDGSISALTSTLGGLRIEIRLPPV